MRQCTASGMLFSTADKGRSVDGEHLAKDRFPRPAFVDQKKFEKTDDDSIPDRLLRNITASRQRGRFQYKVNPKSVKSLGGNEKLYAKH